MVGAAFCLRLGRHGPSGLHAGIRLGTGPHIAASSFGRWRDDVGRATG